KPTKGVTLPGHTEGPKPVNDAAQTMVRPATAATAAVAHKPRTLQVGDGSVVIAAITSCTNTSNPSVMIGAGLLAKKAIEKGLAVKPHVKTTLAPGSRVVTRYLEAAGLTPYLEQLGFYLVGFGCTVCIGNSGPLATPEIEQEVKDHDLNVVTDRSRLSMGAELDVCAGATLLPELLGGVAGGDRRHRQRARARLSRRLGDHRPHLARRSDSRGEPGRPVPRV